MGQRSQAVLELGHWSFSPSGGVKCFQLVLSPSEPLLFQAGEQWSADDAIIFDKPHVIAGEAQEAS